MPRAVKQEPQDSEPRYTRESLEKIGRKRIQELAKKKSIKANMKSYDIITALLKLFNGPEEAAVVQETIHDAVEPSAANEPSTQEETYALVSETSTRDDPGTAALRAARRSVSSDDGSGSPSDRASLSRRRVTPYQRRRVFSGSRSKSPQARGEGGTPRMAATAAIDPTDKDVRDVRRRLTALSNDQILLKGKVREMQRHLEFSSGTLERGTRLLEEMAWRREAIEDGIVVQVSYTRHLWDGSVHMAEADRKKWRRFVAENQRGHAYIQENGDSEGGEMMEDEDEDETRAIGEVSQALIEDDGEDMY